MNNLDRLEKLYWYLREQGSGAFYWHYLKDYENLKKEILK